MVLSETGSFRLQNHRDRLNCSVLMLFPQLLSVRYFDVAAHPISRKPVSKSEKPVKSQRKASKYRVNSMFVLESIPGSYSLARGCRLPPTRACGIPTCSPPENHIADHVFKSSLLLLLLLLGISSHIWFCQVFAMKVDNGGDYLELRGGNSSTLSRSRLFERLSGYGLRSRK